jgi:hypothetical protein
MSAVPGENERRPRRPLGRKDIALGNQARHAVPFDAPEGVAGGRRVERRRHIAFFVGAADEPQRPVELVHLVQQDVQVERQGLGNAVFVVMGGEIVVPLPDLTGKGDLGVDLGLLDVEPLVVQDLPGGLDQAGMARHPPVGLVAQVEAHGGAHLAGDLLPEILRHVFGE